MISRAIKITTKTVYETINSWATNSFTPSLLTEVERLANYIFSKYSSDNITVMAGTDPVNSNRCILSFFDANKLLIEVDQPIG